MTRAIQRTPPLLGAMAALVLVAGATAVSTAHACPSCAAGRQARSEVWNDDFAFNVLVALLPFVVIGGICVCAERSRRP